MTTPIIIGHRGAAGHFPENTLGGFDRAVALGAQGIELDVHLCASGEPVVIHDETLDRTTNGRGFVRDHALDVLSNLDAGEGETLPTLAQVFDHLDKRCRIFIEIKADEAAIPAALLAEKYVLEHGWHYEQLVLIAFNHQLLLDIQHVNPRLHTGALFVGIPATLCQIASDAGAIYALPAIGQLNARLVEDAQQRKLKVFTWTCNTAAQILKAKALGVDGIMGDYPDRVVEQLALA